jgi:hypothetical protein
MTVRRVSKENTLTIDSTKLKDVLNNPDREKDFHEVFSFVETITDQHPAPETLNQQNIEAWNQRFDEVLEQLFNTGNKNQSI